MKTIIGIKLLGMILFMPFILEAQHHGSTQTSAHHHDMKSIPMIRWKFYAGLGGTLYGGELTGHKLGGSNSALKGTRGRPAATLGVAYKLHDRFFVKGELSYCFIKGSETDISMEKAGRKQPFQFRSDNYDLVVLGQFNILPHTYLMTQRVHIIPYVVLGIGLTTNRPKGYYNGHWESLKKLTDGQIKHNIMGVLPFGFGGMYRINNQIDIGLDATVRYGLGRSLDGDVRGGISTANLSAEGKAFFDQYYASGTKTVLKDYPKYHDMYTVLQVRIYYTIVPEKYKHMFKGVNINYSDKPKKGFLRTE
jgi:hypothetical protein